MVLVLNSTPLIYLAKSNALTLLEALPRRKVTSETVHEEVVIEGKEKGAADAVLVEKLFDRAIVEVESVEQSDFLQSLTEIPGLHRADSEVLALAQQMKGTAIIDDERARNIADLKGIPNHGTAYILIKLKKSGRLSKEEARNTLDEMVKAGWKCSTEVYSKILEALGY